MAHAIATAALELDGHEVAEADDGPSGIQRASTWAPDVALIDIGLPGMDGYEVARQIRRRIGRSARLIALTGYGDDNARDRGAAAGFDVHLVKPVSLGELRGILASG